jgi:hypothetical protein
VDAGKPTFAQVADALVEAKAPEWRNEKHRAQWRSDEITLDEVERITI